MSESNGGGRPIKYKTEYDRQAIKLCKLGATDVDLAEFFGVCERTINNWKKEYPSFKEALNTGKKIPNEMVKQALFNRAIGLTLVEEKEESGKDGVKTTITKKQVAPDTAACFIWLKNRDSENWRDRQTVDTNLVVTKANDNDW